MSFLTINNVLGELNQDFEGYEIVCPVCGYEYQHVKEMSNIKGHDDYKAWEGRGDLAIIKFLGECGSEWSMSFGFHKGITYFKIKVIKSCRSSE